ncbi:hypothetical protein ONZ45_g2738 [Pleurotus djamor]|nr:hypothetical protein ONZ45_g2738 [Pleurotus djamor]
MGNSSSIFYPDNPKRRDRAQQLADDCTNCKNQYDAKHAEIEAILGPYKEKLDKVLRAFGCSTLDDLDRVVQKNATGQALDDWNNTKNIYDKTQIVDQVIMGAMGTIAIAGLAISTVGALAGGFGFFVGLAVTSDILLALGVIGAIFDIVNGAIQRSKLRDSINDLFESRIKIKQVLAHIDNLNTWIPSITAIYQAYEEAGYDPEKIIERFKTKGLMKPLEQDLRDDSFRQAAVDLNEIDRNRGSWTNEDPNWEEIVNRLQSNASSARSEAFAVAADSVMKASTISFAVGADRMQKPVEILPPDIPSVKVKLYPTIPLEIPHLTKPLEMVFLDFVDDKSAEVLFRTDDSHFVSVDHYKGRLQRGFADKCTHVARWIVTLADDFQPPEFLDRKDHEAKVTISTEDGGKRWYMDSNGDLFSDKHGPEPMILRYA